MIARLPLKAKMAVISVTVVLLSGMGAMIAGGHFINSGFIGQAQTKVQHDLNTARFIYDTTVNDVSTKIWITADRFLIWDSILKGNRARLKSELSRICKREGLDVLTVTDVKGRVLARSCDYRNADAGKSGNPILLAMLPGSTPKTGTFLVPREELLKEGAGLAEQAHIKFVPTEKAGKTTETESTSGMMIGAAYPILDNSGTMIGRVYGGVLLNRNYYIVDKIKETVHRSMRYKGRDAGTATILQKDLRISTNVSSRNGSRAIGTRLSEEVSRRVLSEGNTWIGRAFVVNDWYLTAYEPIKNLSGVIVGVLYVGVLEQPYIDIRRKTMLFFLGLTLVGMITAMCVSYVMAGGVTGPLGRLAEAARRLADGDLGQTIKIESEDEVGELEKAFISMASSIRERDDWLKHRAQLIIMETERLAMIGQLAAGVAHEINNPLGGILVYSHLLLEDGGLSISARDSVEKIVTQTTRCKNIVKGLLDFSRQTKPEKRLTDVNRLLDTTLALVEKQALFQNIMIVRHLAAGMPPVELDSSQIQQVFMNLIINAAEAMQGKGELTVRTSVSDGRRMSEIEFKDTGCGISAENMKHLFEPFFTTKEVGHGTGLGLAISYGIVDKHGGEIRVASEAGKGASFTVRLPTAQGT
jgi:two-component system NtrC family sensor kinase